MRFAIVAHRAGETNIGLITRGWSVFEPLLLTPREALMTLAPGDAALGRLDIREGLDGIEDGLWALSELSASGISVLNPPSALISAHDKPVTARALRRAGLAHPETRPLICPGADSAARPRSSPRRRRWLRRGRGQARGPTGRVADERCARRHSRAGRPAADRLRVRGRRSSRDRRRSRWRRTCSHSARAATSSWRSTLRSISRATTRSVKTCSTELSAPWCGAPARARPRSRYRSRPQQPPDHAARRIETASPPALHLGTSR